MEVFYHAIIVLSCRLPPLNPSVPPLQIHTQIPPPAANCRRTLAAERITLVIGTEFPYPGSETPAPSVLKTLPLLPVVPYALSLSLSVAYRKIRYTHTRVGLFFDRAKSTFALNCALLRTMGEAGGVWSARVLAAMADRVLGEMDRKATAVHGGAGDGPGLDVPRAVAQPTSLPASPESTTQTAAAAAESIALTQPSDWQQKHPNHAMGSSAADDTGVVAIAPASQPPAWDWDAFGQLLDPAFLDLDAVDAALEANLDVGATAALPWGWAGWRGFELDVDGGGA